MMPARLNQLMRLASTTNASLRYLPSPSSPPAHIAHTVSNDARQAGLAQLLCEAGLTHKLCEP
jgi:hypothetical protein